MLYFLPLAAAAIIGVLGMLHLIYTLRDIVSRPRYFVPRDPALLDAMRGTQAALAPNGHDFWSVLLGIHLTHSIGLLLFALLIVLTVVTPLPALKPLMIGVGLRPDLYRLAVLLSHPSDRSCARNRFDDRWLAAVAGIANDRCDNYSPLGAKTFRLELRCVLADHA